MTQTQSKIMQRMLVDKQEKQNLPFISYEYIRGIIEGEGCFTFYPGSRKKDGIKYKLPAFVIAMHERDKNLIKIIRDTLGLRNSIYTRSPTNKDGYNRGKATVLVVREFDQLKDIIIPFFYKKLYGNKGKQFIEWLEKIGSDPNVSNRYKSLYRIYKFGIYDKQEFLKKFID